MRLMYFALLFFMLVLQTPSARATELYANQTGQPCAFCHLDPAGGGELTKAGQAFAASRQETAATPKITPLSHGFRFLIGYLHLLTAILWFGTILYVHLVLKPAYASGGLPRGEVRVGLLSMAVMGVTGAILTYYRIDSWQMLLQTRFGILLLIKVIIYLIMVVSALVVVTVIGPRLKARRGQGASLVESGDLTPEELASYDGKEGRPAYFGYQGRIYDASQSRLWKQGVHMGRHNAGLDLTEALELAPHGPDKILPLREVGKLLVSGAGKAPLHERVFYAMAYMNLGAVFLIILILALWRWW